MKVADWIQLADQSLGPDGCWPATAGLGTDGYPHRSFTDTRERSLARVALAYRLGRAIAPGLHALHTCDNRACINPAHLYEGTAGDNARDRSARGRHRNLYNRTRQVIAWTNDGRVMYTNGPEAA